MRAIVAKRLRKQVYGKGTHTGKVQYFRRGKPSEGSIVADKKRQEYQQAKKKYNAQKTI